MEQSSERVALGGGTVYQHRRADRLVTDDLPGLMREQPELALFVGVATCSRLPLAHLSPLVHFPLFSRRSLHLKYT